MNKWAPVICIFLFFGCDRRDPKVIPSREMTTLLWDMIQVDEFATGYLLKDSAKNINTERLKLYKQVFALHKITEKQFSASFNYYASRPDILKVVFDSLSKKAERERHAMYMPKDTLAKPLPVK
ncbi:MAG: DUF4296 domain-containing protein [Chitinophagaceae bacterium]